MSWLRFPPNRWVLACASLGVLGALWLLPRLNLVTLARTTLALCVTGILWALSLRRRRAPAPPPRLTVAARLALSAKCSLALVEVDEVPYLVTFGDGFAQVIPAPGNWLEIGTFDPEVGSAPRGREGWAR